jgi:hypothetical protein
MQEHLVLKLSMYGGMQAAAPDIMMQGAHVLL